VACIFERSNSTAIESLPTAWYQNAAQGGGGGCTALPLRTWYLSSRSPLGGILMYLPEKYKRLAGGDGLGSDA